MTKICLAIAISLVPVYVQSEEMIVNTAQGSLLGISVKKNKQQISEPWGLPSIGLLAPIDGTHPVETDCHDMD